jgi:hypothetical protein
MPKQIIPHPVDIMQPWTIKSFSTEIRNLAVRQAQIEGVTVGQWLEQCIRAYIGAGSPTVVKTTSAVLQPAAPAYSPLDGLQQLAAINPQLVQDKLTSDRLQALARHLALRAKRETRSETHITLPAAT